MSQIKNLVKTAEKIEIREVPNQKIIILLLDHRKKQFPEGVVGGLGVATFSHLRHVVPPLGFPDLDTATGTRLFRCRFRSPSAGELMTSLEPYISIPAN